MKTLLLSFKIFLNSLILILIFEELSFAQTSIEFQKDKVAPSKYIRNIIIETRDISSETLTKEETFLPKWFGSVVNSLHIKTQDWVVEDYLLFEEGDIVDNELLEESERLLRDSGIFLDARIKVINDQNDSVDVQVITKDKWTLSFNISYEAKNQSGYFGLTDDNFLGYGHFIKANASYEKRRNIGWGGVFNYRANNISGTYFNSEALLISNDKILNRTFSVSRPFYKTDTRYAGGLEVSWINGDAEFIDGNNQASLISYREQKQDIWAGRSYPVFFGPEIFRSKSRFVTSFRYSRTRFPSRPDITQTAYRIYENQDLYLVNFGFINRRYFKDHYINGFGRTEDIELGGILSFTLGSDVREYHDRWYIGLRSVYSRSIPLVGYFSGEAAFGGFRNMGEWEQNVLSFNFLYHSPLEIYSDFKLRHFLEFDYLLGTNRFTGEQIFLNIFSGLRGIDGYELNGLKRIVLNLETRIFTNLAPLGFVIGGIVFTDFGMIAESEENLLTRKIYQAYGIGLRTSNESFSGASFEVSLVYNPFDYQNSSGSFGILFSGSFVLGSRVFGFSKPSIISYDNSSIK